MERILRLKVNGSRVIHLGTADSEGYRSSCGKSITGKRVSTEVVTESRGDECIRCQERAEGKWESVGGRWLDAPGGTKFPRPTKRKTPLLPRRKPD